MSKQSNTITFHFRANSGSMSRPIAVTVTDDGTLPFVELCDNAYEIAVQRAERHFPGSNDLEVFEE